MAKFIDESFNNLGAMVYRLEGQDLVLSWEDCDTEYYITPDEAEELRDFISSVLDEADEEDDSFDEEYA